MSAASEKHSEEKPKEHWTQFGYALACLGLAAFCFGAPSFFELELVTGLVLSGVIGSTIGTVFSVICYLAGTIFAFYTASFLSSSFDKHP